MHRKIKQYIDKYKALGYGEDHLLFACHAAFPTGVTVHMLYQLWANFSIVPGRSRPIDSIVISDFLLSNLVRETALGIFEINGEVRAALLDTLKSDERFGQKRLEALAFFLYQYIQRSVQERDYDTFRETQYWTAMSVIAPNRVAQEIGDLLGKKITQEDAGEIFRLNKVLEQISPQDGGLNNLLNFSRGVRDDLLEKPTASLESYNKVIVAGDDPSGEQLSLKIPLRKSELLNKVQFKKAPTPADLEAEKRIQYALESGMEKLFLNDIAGLKRVPDSIQQLTQLRELFVYNSDLEVFPDLRKLENLEVADLSLNQLTFLPNFLPEGSLKLDVHHNQLTGMDASILGRDRLEALILSENQLKIFPGGAYKEQILSRARGFQLNDNPWLNLPVPIEEFSLEDAIDDWKFIPSGKPCIQLIAIGYSVGEMLLDLRARFDEWTLSGQIELTAHQILGRYHLYHYPSAAEVNIPFLYMTGEDFRLNTGMEESGPEPLAPADFAALLENRALYTNVVILNVSFSSDYAEALLAVGFRAVIATRFVASEQQRFEFQEQFFGALLSGASIREAYDEVMNTTSGNNPYESDFGYSQTRQEPPIQQQTESESSALPVPWYILEAPEAEVNWDWRLPTYEEASPDVEPFNLRDYKNLIAEDKLEEVFDGLLRDFFLDKNLQNDLTILNANFSRVEERSRENTIRKDVFDREKSRIRSALLEFIDGLPSEKGSDNSPEGAVRLKRMIGNYQVSRALSDLSNYLRGHSSFLPELNNLEERWLDLNLRISQNTIREEEARVDLNRFLRSLVDWISNLPAEVWSVELVGPTAYDPNILKSWKDLIADDQLDEVFSELWESFKDYTKLQNELVILEARFSRIERNIALGRISSGESNIEKNSLRNSLLGIIKGIDNGRYGYILIQRDVAALPVVKDVKDLLRKSNLEEVFSRLKSFLPEGSNQLSQMLTFERRWNDLNNNQRINTIGYEDAEIECNQIISGLLFWLDHVPGEDWEQSNPDDQEFEEEAQLFEWKANQRGLIRDMELVKWIDQFETFLSQNSQHYNGLVVQSNSINKLERQRNEGVLDPTEFNVQRNRIFENLIGMLNEMETDDFRPNPTDDRPSDVLSSLQYQLKSYLRKNEWPPLWSEMEESIKPELTNFGRFYLRWKYNRFQTAQRNNTLSNEEEARFNSGFILEICDFIDGLTLERIKAPNVVWLLKTPLDFFNYQVLQLLEEGSTRNLLFYINENLAPTRGLSNQFTEWERQLQQIEDDFRTGTISLTDTFREYDPILQQWKSFLENEMTEAVLREDFLESEESSLQNQIDALANQKSVDTQKIQALQRDLFLLQDLLVKRETEKVDWQAWVYFYELIAENRLMQAAEEMEKALEDIQHAMARQVADLRQSLDYLERDRQKIPYNEYTKERNRIIDGLVISLNDVIATVKLPASIKDPDLLGYVRDQVNDNIKKGEMKGAFGYLREALAPATSGINQVVELSARYYELESAQYRKDVEYGRILEELSSFERYLNNLLDASLELRHDFVDRERQRLETALQNLSQQSKSKKFDLSQDGDYQRLRGALDFLRKFTPKI